jgi:hypothetical protein
MATWADMEARSPAVAKLGRKLLISRGRGFLATTRCDGSPRVHAICPVIWDGRLVAGIIRSTPKYADLVRDGRFALHAPLHEGDAEFWVTGVAEPMSDKDVEEMMSANPSWRTPVPNAMFHLSIRTAHGTIFRPGADHLPVPDRRSFRDDDVGVGAVGGRTAE